MIATSATPTKWINTQCSPLMPVMWWGAWSERSSHGGWCAGSTSSLGCDDYPATPNILQFVEDILEWSPWSSPNAWFVWALVNQISSLLVAHWYMCCWHIDVVYSNSNLYSSRRLDEHLYIQNKDRGRTTVILCLAWYCVTCMSGCRRLQPSFGFGTSVHPPMTFKYIGSVYMDMSIKQSWSKVHVLKTCSFY